MDGEQVFFNGIDATSGDYLLPAMSAEAVGKLALGERWDKVHLKELSRRIQKKQERTLALKAGLDPLRLEEAGWGVIFPAWWDDRLQSAVQEALSELLDRRKEQAGPLYREFRGEHGYQPGESKDEFLTRHGAAPGPVDPAAVPYYLLIAGDPDTIPYRFQYELDVAYAVGRIFFSDLNQYAAYARSVVHSETRKEGLPRQAVFFGTANPNDPATQLSSEQLAQPLAERMAKVYPDWEVQQLQPADCTKSRLQSLLGGKQTPALLFTASHGVGFPNGDARQLAFQGALVCQDWNGPGSGGIGRDHYLAAEDIGSEAGVLGLISFHFACFGAGTPERDQFSRQGSESLPLLAPYPFVAALPQRVLGHERGGALAVVGHVDRAWGYSITWGQAGAQITSFESSLQRLMGGATIGLAVDDLNLRYAELATMLSGAIEEAEYKRKDYRKLAQLWMAHNDARGYAVLGDPAVRLPVLSKGTEQGQESPQRGVIEPPPERSGKVPISLSGLSGPAMGSSLASEGEFDFQVGEAPRTEANRLEQAQDELAGLLSELAESKKALAGLRDKLGGLLQG